MKSISHMMATLLLIFGLILIRCSRVEIQKPAKKEPNVITRYPLVLKHTGFGEVTE